MLSMSRLHGFLLGLADPVRRLAARPGALVAARLERRSAAPGAAAPRAEAAGRRRWRPWLLFVGAGCSGIGPMAALAGAGPDVVVFDVHSHTNVSHDVRGTLMGGFDTEANLRWHRRAGFDAVLRDGPQHGRRPPSARRCTRRSVRVSR